MLNYKDIKKHHDTSIQDCTRAISGFRHLLPDDMQQEITSALVTWGAYRCDRPDTPQEDVAIGIAALSNACIHGIETGGEPAKICGKIRDMVDILNHKLLPHTVDEEPMLGTRLPVRAGVCPICGQPVTTVLSQDRCYYCDSRLNWR